MLPKNMPRSPAVRRDFGENAVAVEVGEVCPATLTPHFTQISARLLMMDPQLEQYISSAPGLVASTGLSFVLDQPAMWLYTCLTEPLKGAYDGYQHKNVEYQHENQHENQRDANAKSPPRPFPLNPFKVFNAVPSFIPPRPLTALCP